MSGKKLKIELTEAEAKLLVGLLGLHAEALSDESCNNMPDEISNILTHEEWEPMFPQLLEIEMKDPDMEDPALFPNVPKIDDFANCTPSLHIVNVLLNQLPKKFSEQKS